MLVLAMMACASGQFHVAADGVERAADRTANSGVRDSGSTDTDTPPPPPLELCINEFMADNEAVVADETGAYADWVELHNPGDTAVSLDGWAVGDKAQDRPKTKVSDGLAVPAGGYLLLWADGLVDLLGAHVAATLASAGGTVTLYAPDGRGSEVTYGAVPPDFSVARVPDCCVGEGCFSTSFRGTPGASNVALPEDVEVAIPRGSTWRYYDQGAAPAGWNAAGFDDSLWAAGPGPLGYGDAYQVTALGFGPDENNKFLTSYYRAAVELRAVAAVTEAYVNLLRDDGAVVYVNGAELVRVNMAPGDVTDTTLASVSTSGVNEEAYWRYDIDPATLVEGANTIAVEVHQASVASSDLGFDLELVAERPAR